MQYYPLIKPQDIAVKNDGKMLIIKIRSQEYEFRKETVTQLIDMVSYIIRAKHPTGWITGYEDIKKEEQIELWPSAQEDDDPIVGAV